jgi:hypothetical protein
LTDASRRLKIARFACLTANRSGRIYIIFGGWSDGSRRWWKTQKESAL